MCVCVHPPQYEYSSRHSGTFSVGVVGMEDVDLSTLDFTYVSSSPPLPSSPLLSPPLPVLSPPLPSSPLLSPPFLSPPLPSSSLLTTYVS